MNLGIGDQEAQLKLIHITYTKVILQKCYCLWNNYTCMIDRSVGVEHRYNNTVHSLLYVYVLIFLSSSLEDFITYGISHLHVIVQSGYPKMATPLIAMVVPIFLEQGHPDYLITNER